MGIPNQQHPGLDIGLINPNVFRWMIRVVRDHLEIVAPFLLQALDVLMTLV